MKRLFFGVLLLCTGAAQATTPPAQVDILVALFNSTSGGGWTTNTNWLTGDPCANNWFGVLCDSNSNIQRLSLYSNNLVGSIPPELGSLELLEILYLDGNQLTGSIPSQLGNLSSLETMFLSSNQLTGSIPAELGSLSNLQSLLLNNNQLTGSIPSQLGDLGNLKTLELYSNQLTGSIPAELGNLSSLETLYLDYNQLSGSIPAEMGAMTHLQTAFLNNNQLGGTIPSELGDLMNLKTLLLHNNQLTGSIPGELGTLTNLRNLELHSNQMLSNIPTQLGQLESLQTLYLDSNRLSGSVPGELINLSELQALSLSWNALYTTDAALDEFLDSKQLGGDWSTTQTVPPSNVGVGQVTDQSLSLTWDTIEYTGNMGRYRVWCSPSQGGPHSDCGATLNKSTPTIQVSGLTPATQYYFEVRTETDGHLINPNDLISDPSLEISVVMKPAGYIFGNGFESVTDSP